MNFIVQPKSRPACRAIREKSEGSSGIQPAQTCSRFSGKAMLSVVGGLQDAAKRCVGTTWRNEQRQFEEFIPMHDLFAPGHRVAHLICG
jgi:hypothetical protein